MYNYDIASWLYTTLTETYVEHYYKQKRREEKRFVEYKRKNGLTEEERLQPADSRCNHSLIKNIEILSEEPAINDDGRNCTLIKQKVTYVDDSEKIFNLYITLRGLPAPENFFKNLADKPKVKRK